MLVSLKWLSDYVTLGLPPRDLAERLSIAGAKVERILTHGDEWDGVALTLFLDTDELQFATPERP